MATKKQPEFNKVVALDEYAKLVNILPDSSMSKIMESLQNAQNYFQKIHDDAFALGFEKGCDATTKVDQL